MQVRPWHKWTLQQGPKNHARGSAPQASQKGKQRPSASQGREKHEPARSRGSALLGSAVPLLAAAVFLLLVVRGGLPAPRVLLGVGAGGPGVAAADAATQQVPTVLGEVARRQSPPPAAKKSAARITKYSPCHAAVTELRPRFKVTQTGCMRSLEARPTSSTNPPGPLIEPT